MKTVVGHNYNILFYRNFGFSMLNPKCRHCLSSFIRYRVAFYILLFAFFPRAENECHYFSWKVGFLDASSLSMSQLGVVVALHMFKLQSAVLLPDNVFITGTRPW